jgi:cyclophilin family peptidyl-prolyl cis-trans isomerase/HEAT repeat protein
MVLIHLLVSTALAAVPPRTEAMLVRLESLRVNPVEMAPFVGDPNAEVRARTATALGRLRNPASIASLGTLLNDPEPAVRLTAANALGQTQGSRILVQRRLSIETSNPVRVALINAIGLKGDAWDIDMLLDTVQQPVDNNHSIEEVAAAAEALGQMAVRGISTVKIERVCRTLVKQLRRPNNDIRASTSFALARITPTTLNQRDSESLIQAARDESMAAIKAHLVRATSGLRYGHAVREELLSEAMHHTSASVRIAVARSSASVGWTGLTGMLDDLEPSVVIATIEAIGRMPQLDRLKLLGPIVRSGGLLEYTGSGPVDPKLAKAVAALSALDVPAIWWENDTARYSRVQNGLLPSLTQYMSEDRSYLIRRAATAIATDPGNLLRLANNDPDTGVRTAAANRILGGRGSFSRSMRLLYSNDEMVKATATDWLKDNPNPKAEPALLNLVASAKSPILVQSATLALASHYASLRPRKRKSLGASNLLPGLLGHEDSSVRSAAIQLAKVLQIWPNFSEYSPDPVDIAAVLEIRSAVISTDHGDAIIALYPEHAPLTVQNFARLADAGFYDDLSFHRVIPDFVVQGGDPRGDGLGGPDYTIPDEINELPYIEGTVGMALSGPDTGGSQWFVTLAPQPHLDGRYTVFGQVIQGMNVFRTILAGDRIENVSIERVMSAAGRHEVEMEMATERLAQLNEQTAKTKKKGKAHKRAKKSDEMQEDENPINPDFRTLDENLLGNQQDKKGKKRKKAKKDQDDSASEMPTETPPETPTEDLPDEHDKAPESDTLNEGEKVDVDILENPGEEPEE